MAREDKRHYIKVLLSSLSNVIAFIEVWNKPGRQDATAMGKMMSALKVILGVLHDKLMEDNKLANSAQTSDPRIFTESIFPTAFGNAAMESYMESQDSYSALFEDKTKYNAIMNALAGVIYREMRAKETV